MLEKSNELVIETNAWRKDKRTDKQYKALVNMRRALGWKCAIPLTKGKCVDLFKEMQKEILVRLSVCGSIAIKSCLAACDQGDYDDNDFDEIF